MACAGARPAATPASRRLTRGCPLLAVAFAAAPGVRSPPGGTAIRTDGRDARLAYALDTLAEQRRGEVWDRLLVQLNELAEREALKHPELRAEDTDEELDAHPVGLLSPEGKKVRKRAARGARVRMWPRRRPRLGRLRAGRS